MFLFTLFIKGIAAAIAAILAIVPVSAATPHPTVTNLHQATVGYVNPPNPLVQPQPTPTVTNLSSAPSGYINTPRPCPVCR